MATMLTTDDDIARRAYARRQAAIAARGQARLAYAVGALDAALDAHGKAKARVASRLRAGAVNADLLSRVAEKLSKR